jgi:GH25 family lysozyme M1 (1,4-beta-N-acetylmuramidase)
MAKREFAIDVSNVNPASERVVRDSGSVALICKATEGDSFRDKTLPAHRKIAKTVGIPFGSYVFLHARSAGDEAAAYLAYAKPKRGDIQPVIDAEGGGLDGASMGDMAARVDACARELETHGYRPILYASSSFWTQLVAERPTLRRLRVWEAQYPGLFSRWLPRFAKLRIRLGRGATVVLWQWTDRDSVDGHGYDDSLLLAPLDSLLIP